MRRVYNSTVCMWPSCKLFLHVGVKHLEANTGCALQVEQMLSPIPSLEKAQDALIGTANALLNPESQLSYQHPTNNVTLGCWFNMEF